MRILRDRYFLAVGACHLTVDLLNTQMPMLVVFLSPTIGLSNADIGLIVLIYTASGSITQPVFGWLADRYRIKWISGGSLLWLAVWLSMAASIPEKWVVTALATAALGSAAFHASGIEQATRRGETVMAGRSATAASMFVCFGMVGHALGPIVGGNILESVGLRGIMLLTGLTIPVVIYSLYQMLAVEVHPPRNGRGSVHTYGADAAHGKRKVPWEAMTIAFVIVFNAAPGMTSMTFLPKLLQDRNFSPSVYGMATSVYICGAALGTLLGGFLADRLGRRRIVFWSMLAAVAPMYYYPVIRGDSMYVLVLLAGAFNGASIPVILVMAQNLYPRWRALASGLTMGFMFASGALTTYFFGIAADRYALEDVMRINGVLCLLGAAISLTLRTEGERRIVFSEANDIVEAH